MIGLWLFINLLPNTSILSLDNREMAMLSDNKESVQLQLWYITKQNKQVDVSICILHCLDDKETASYFPNFLLRLFCRSYIFFACFLFFSFAIIFIPIHNYVFPLILLLISSVPPSLSFIFSFVTFFSVTLLIFQLYHPSLFSNKTLSSFLVRLFFLITYSSFTMVLIILSPSFSSSPTYKTKYNQQQTVHQL